VPSIVQSRADSPPGPLCGLGNGLFSGRNERDFSLQLGLHEDENQCSVRAIRDRTEQTSSDCYSGAKVLQVFSKTCSSGSLIRPRTLELRLKTSDGTLFDIHARLS
jgi:hypothetical protein